VSGGKLGMEINARLVKGSVQNTSSGAADVPKVIGSEGSKREEKRHQTGGGPTIIGLWPSSRCAWDQEENPGSGCFRLWLNASLVPALFAGRGQEEPEGLHSRGGKHRICRRLW